MKILHKIILYGFFILLIISLAAVMVHKRTINFMVGKDFERIKMYENSIDGSYNEDTGGLKTCHSILYFYKKRWSLVYEDSIIIDNNIKNSICSQIKEYNQVVKAIEHAGKLNMIEESLLINDSILAKICQIRDNNDYKVIRTDLKLLINKANNVLSILEEIIQKEKSELHVLAPE